MFTHLTIDGKRYSKAWIAANYRSLQTPDQSEHQRTVLTFCGQWFSGQQQFVVRTSGSTGAPRPITLTRERMVQSARMTGQALSLAPGIHALACLPCSSIGGLMMLVRSFELDLALTVTEPSGNPYAAFSSPPVPAFDFTAFVPMQLQAVLESGGEAIVWLNRFKAVLLGGAPVSPSLLAQVRRLTCPVYETFGMTETVSHIALRRLNGAAASSWFRVLPGVEIDTDVRGCLVVNGALTEYQPLTTNDVIELRSQHKFRWIGRVDNVINSGGVKIHAEEVERVIAEAIGALEPTGVQEPAFFVAGLPDETYGSVVVAVFEGQLTDALVQEIRGRIVNQVHRYAVPKRFCSVEQFVRTATGKIDRAATLAMLRDGAGDPA